MSPKQGPEESEINARVLTDDRFRESLLSDPAGTLKREYGVEVPRGLKIEVHEETDEVVHLIVPGRTEGMLKRIEELKGGGSILRMPQDPDTTKCCTCGVDTAQTLSSFQRGCGC